MRAKDPGEPATPDSDRHASGPTPANRSNSQDDCSLRACSSALRQHAEPGSLQPDGHPLCFVRVSENQPACPQLAGHVAEKPSSFPPHQAAPLPQGVLDLPHLDEPVSPVFFDLLIRTVLSAFAALPGSWQVQPLVG